MCAFSGGKMIVVLHRSAVFQGGNATYYMYLNKHTGISKKKYDNEVKRFNKLVTFHRYYFIGKKKQ